MLVVEPVLPADIFSAVPYLPPMLPRGFDCALAQAWDSSGALPIAVVAVVAAMGSTTSKSWLYK